MDTMSEEYKMACLARHVMDECRSTDEMRRWFDRWESKHGAQARADLRDAVIAEKEKQKAEPTPVEKKIANNKQYLDGMKKLSGEHRRAGR